MNRMKSLSSAVVLTTFLLTTSVFAMEQGIEEDSSTTAPYNKPTVTEEKTKSQLIIENDSLITTCLKAKKIIFRLAACETDPADLRLVCKNWRNITDQLIITNEEGHDSVALRDLLAELNAIYYGPLLNLKLKFTPNDKDMRTVCRPKGCHPLKFTFDLSGCELPHDMGWVTHGNVFTTSMELFFNDNIETNYIENKISKNTGKLLTAFVTRRTVMRHKEEPWAKSLLPYMSLPSCEVRMPKGWDFPGSLGADSNIVLFRMAGSDKTIVDFAPVYASEQLRSSLTFRVPMFKWQRIQSGEPFDTLMFIHADFNI